MYRRVLHEDNTVNQKAVQQIWREEGLQRRRQAHTPPEARGNSYVHGADITSQRATLSCKTMDGRTILKFLKVIDGHIQLCQAMQVGCCHDTELTETKEELFRLYPPPTQLRMKTARGSALRLEQVVHRVYLQHGLHLMGLTLGKPIRGVIQQRLMDEDSLTSNHSHRVGKPSCGLNRTDSSTTPADRRRRNMRVRP